MRMMGRTVAIVNLDFANEQHDWNPCADLGGEKGEKTEGSGSDSEDASTTTTGTIGQKTREASEADSNTHKHCAVDVRQLVRYVGAGRFA